MKLFPFLLLFVLLTSIGNAQNLGYERDRHKNMLKLITEDVRKNYYDPTFRGIDLDAKYKVTAEKIEQAASIGQMSAIIAQFLVDFEDSHLTFIPPGKVNKTDYGFDYRMYGDRCFVYKVREKSDAAKQGLSVGDEIYALEGYGPTRENLWKMQYFYRTLRPRPVLRLEVVKPDGKQLKYEINAKITPGRQIMDLTGGDINQILREQDDAYERAVKQFFYDKIPDLFIWKLGRFSLEPAKVDDIMDRVRKSQNLIIDLRGNSGGRVDMLARLIGNFFPEDLKIADEKRRKETKELRSRSRGKDAFTGKVVVLIDSQSASASEIFARVVQLEKRGIVVGDRSAGAVMESRYFGHQTGIDVVAFYGASITIADLIMKDGKSLEKTGVLPDETVLPTGRELADRYDRTMTRAAEILGFKISPEEAGRLFNVEYEIQ